MVKRINKRMLWFVVGLLILLILVVVVIFMLGGFGEQTGFSLGESITSIPIDEVETTTKGT